MPAQIPDRAEGHQALEVKPEVTPVFFQMGNETLPVPVADLAFGDAGELRHLALVIELLHSMSLLKAGARCSGVMRIDEIYLIIGMLRPGSKRE